jgi:hypothetical protein
MFRNDLQVIGSFSYMSLAIIPLKGAITLCCLAGLNKKNANSHDKNILYYEPGQQHKSV